MLLLQVIVGYKKNRMVFRETTKCQLEYYILRTSDIYFDLSPKEIRTLVYQIDNQNSMNIFLS